MRLVKYTQLGHRTITASVMAGNTVMWVCETILRPAEHISVAVKRLSRLIKREFPQEKFDVSVPLDWLL